MKKPMIDESIVEELRQAYAEHQTIDLTLDDAQIWEIWLDSVGSKKAEHIKQTVAAMAVRSRAIA